MLCIRSQTLDPAFNIATEEYLIRHKEEDCFYLYINRPSIIVGKHQNTLAEINTDYVQAQNIDVIRRMTGGGAVFHDPGNLNFCFIQKENGERTADFRKYTQPILDVLNQLGIAAKFEGRNDLTIDGKKISGNAKGHFHGKVLQHGTLLFSSRLPDLSQALKINPLKYQDKAVKSVRSRVTNISEHLQQELTLEALEDLILKHIRSLYSDSVLYALQEEDIQGIENLVSEKYGSWDWNFGQSPQYNFQKGIKTAGGHLEVHLDVHKGRIENAKLYGDFFNTHDVNELEQELVGLPHEAQALRDHFNAINISKYMAQVSTKEFVEALL